MSKTNSPGKNMAYISTSINKEILAIIDERSKKTGITRGSYLRHILTQWYDRGCPSVSKVDQLIIQSESQTFPAQSENKPSLKVAEDGE
ncbi:MAG: hypothetical protein P8I61_02365 [Opitutae bacterium]|nr:hypothetical protein [Opitutae bacterium]